MYKRKKSNIRQIDRLRVSGGDLAGIPGYEKEGLTDEIERRKVGSNSFCPLENRKSLIAHLTSFNLQTTNLKKYRLIDISHLER